MHSLLVTCGSEGSLKPLSVVMYRWVSGLAWCREVCPVVRQNFFYMCQQHRNSSFKVQPQGCLKILHLLILALSTRQFCPKNYIAYLGEMKSFANDHFWKGVTSQWTSFWKQIPCPKYDNSQTSRAKSPLNPLYTWCIMLLTGLHLSPPPPLKFSPLSPPPLRCTKVMGNHKIIILIIVLTIKSVIIVLTINDNNNSINYN